MLRMRDALDGWRGRGPRVRQRNVACSKVILTQTTARTFKFDD